MELELKHACLDAYETGGELLLTQEETLETIVPDYCPDMARIISAEGNPCVHNRELRDGKAAVAGVVRITVLYTPEGEGGIRALNFSMPFTVECENRILQGCQILTAEVGLEFLESRMLNPRKIFTHCRIIVRLAGYCSVPLCFCTDVEAEPQFGIEKRREQQKAILLTEISEKDFTFTEELNLSPGRSGAAELLSSRICSTVMEMKTVGNKLIFKGVFTISILYRSVEGTYCSTTGELPFSQIMESENCEGCVPMMQLSLTGSDLQISGDDPEGRQIGVTLYLHATALLRREQELTLLNDLYSTAYETRYEASPLTLTAFCDTMTRRQMMHEVLEVGAGAETILALSVSCGAVTVSRERENVTLRTGATIRALYLDENGAALTAERTVDTVCQMELPEECRITVRAVCAEEVRGSLGDRGIEVRFPVDFSIVAASRVKRVSISAVKLSEETLQNRAGEPSLVLRCLVGRETAWDLAKRYHTTISTILAANKLEHEAELPYDRLLLIPRKRS